MTEEFRYREIPYNYTSLSDREIILRYFDETTLGLIEHLRGQRVTGRSARLLAEVIGDMFMIERNPYVLEDFLRHPKRLRELRAIHRRRLDTVRLAAAGNADAEELLGRVLEADRDFFDRVEEVRRLRQRLVMALLGRTARKNVSFAPFHRIAHSTDATDWRVEHPLAVVFPDADAELPGIIAATRALGLPVVPRGGGTGLTAGAVPVRRNTVVLNVEKLNRIRGIAHRNTGVREIPCVAVEAGCVTDDVIEYCRSRGYIFATDPTSAWASTIGGNIAENAGGKKCVQWGTAIDNLLSWQIVCANGERLEIRRRDHPHRKIRPDDTVVFDVVRIAPGPETLRRTITLLGTEIRKPGLGKDITNKTLKGLPGIQKEGGDGIITGAEFVLYRPFAHCRTLCLEFFGQTMANAAQAILQIREAFDGQGPAVLTALEHFDTRYVRAIGYRNKSSRTDFPQAVLLIDVEGDDPEAVAAAAADIAAIASAYDTEAVDCPFRSGARRLLARPKEPRCHRTPHQCVQAERGRGHPPRSAPGFRRIHRTAEPGQGASSTVWHSPGTWRPCFAAPRRRKPTPRCASASTSPSRISSLSGRPCIGIEAIPNAGAPSQRRPTSWAPCVPSSTATMNFPRRSSASRRKSSGERSSSQRTCTRETGTST